MSFDSDTVDKVWNKGNIVGKNDPQIWRQDQCGAWIKKNEYGNTKSEYGWQIDHITPVSKGGSNSLSNLRPLQWENNEKKSDGNLKCAKVAKNEHNVNV